MLKYAYILFLLLLGCKSSTSPSLNDSSSIEPETFFAHSISSKVAFYFFESIKIKEDNLSSNDWIGAFKGQMCVGARRWNTCDASACEIPIYGENELNELLEYILVSVSLGVDINGKTYKELLNEI